LYNDFNPSNELVHNQEPYPELDNTPDSASNTNDSPKGTKKRYTIISDQTRQQLIECVIQNGEKIKDAAKRLKINYSSAKAICQIYRREGRSTKIIFKKRTNRPEKTDMYDSPNLDKVFLSLDSKPEREMHYTKLDLDDVHDNEGSDRYGLNRSSSFLKDCLNQPKPIRGSYSSQDEAYKPIDLSYSYDSYRDDYEKYKNSLLAGSFPTPSSYKAGLLKDLVNNSEKTGYLENMNPSMGDERNKTSLANKKLSQFKDRQNELCMGMPIYYNISHSTEKYSSTNSNHNAINPYQTKPNQAGPISLSNLPKETEAINDTSFFKFSFKQNLMDSSSDPNQNLHTLNLSRNNSFSEYNYYSYTGSQINLSQLDMYPSTVTADTYVQNNATSPIS